MQWCEMRAEANRLWQDFYGARDDRWVPSHMATAYDMTLRGCYEAKDHVIALCSEDRHLLHLLLQCGVCRCRIESVFEGWNYAQERLIRGGGDMQWASETNRRVDVLTKNVRRVMSCPDVIYARDNVRTLMLDDLARVECSHPVAAIAKAEHAQSRPSHQARHFVGMNSAREALEAARSRTAARASLPASHEIVHQLAKTCRVPDSPAYTREKQGQPQYLVDRETVYHAEGRNRPRCVRSM